VFGFNELSTPVKAIIALAIVLVLVLIAGLLLRRVAGGRLKLPGQGARARQPRLGIVDIFEMDRQRQLVLLRRDNVEHLVMIGGPNDLVIEASIVRSAARAQVPPAGEAPEKMIATAVPDLPPEPAAEPAPRPNRAAITLGPDVAQTAEPAPKVPLPVTVAAAGGLAASAATLTVATSPAKSAVPEMPTAVPAAKPPELPQVTAPLQPSPTQFDDDLAASFEAELSKLAMPPTPVVEKTTPEKPILEQIAPTPLARASADELDDMTKQLQEALKRPFSGVKPAATQMQDLKALATTAVEPSAPADMAPIAKAVFAVTEPPGNVPPTLEAMPDNAPPRTSASSMPDTPKVSSFDFDLERELASALEPVPVPGLVAREIVVPKVAPPEPNAIQKVFQGGTSSEASSAPDSPAQDAAAAVEAGDVPVRADADTREHADPPPQPNARSVPETGKADPFSVDAIEAEFARLLNRGAPSKN
jgi:flagellar protein FliO/FliZ